MGKLDLPPDWIHLTPGDAERFEIELRQELCSEHVLYGVTVKALARKERRDDFLFRIPDECLAQVHLTWRYEASPLFPSTDVFPSMDDWKSFLKEDENS